VYNLIYDFTKTRDALKKNSSEANALASEGEVARYFKTKTEILAVVVLENDDESIIRHTKKLNAKGSDNLFRNRSETNR
jgi:hypothetical protein